MPSIYNWLRCRAERIPQPLRRLVTRYFRFLLPYRDAPKGKKTAERRHHNGQAKKKASLAQRLARAIWAGFGTCAAKELEAIESNGGQPTRERAKASRALSRWYAFIGDHERALRSFRASRLGSPLLHDDVRQLALEIETLLRLGHFDEAKALVQQAIVCLGELPELCLAAANALACDHDLPECESDRLRLAWLNKPLESGGLTPLELKAGHRPLLLDNIAARSTDRSCYEAARVSVLMPVYNAERTIATAVESVLGQTWTNLELVIVDDGSRDETWTLVQAFASRDSRVIGLRHRSNRGAYPARNTALAAATGELVTVQDSDDWSHPQRVSLQASALLQGGQLVNTTDYIRADRHLHVRVNRDGTVLGQNYSSFMTQREALLSLGGWDECKVGADNELYTRLLLKYGVTGNVVKPKVPLCIAATSDHSLTGRPDIGIVTYHYGARREYREAYGHWHRLEAAKDSTDWFKLPADRRFPVPNLCKLGPYKPLIFDILFVSDYSHRGNITSRGVNMLGAAHALGLHCGCFHWPRLLNAGTDITFDVRQLLHEGIAETVVAGETVACSLVIINDALLLRHVPDRLPVVRTENCVILATETLLSKGTPSSHSMGLILNSAHSAFGVKPLLAPNSADMRRALLAAGYCQDLTALDWTSLPDSTETRSGDTLTDSATGKSARARFMDQLEPYLGVPPTGSVGSPPKGEPQASPFVYSDNRAERIPYDRLDIRTVLVVLEYCGGERTDELFSQLRSWNPGARILVLDNASPAKLASCVTHRNSVNSYVGGGINDCIDLARAEGADYLFFCANDIRILDRLDIAEFQRVADLDPLVVQFSCSVTPDSTQATNFPWMVRRHGSAIRRVRQADLVCCLIRLDFLTTFGGFPSSKGGWGYSAELAFHAKLLGRKIYVDDRCTFEHLSRKRVVVTEWGETVDKSTEVARIYSKRYGDWLLPRSALAEPPFDETLDVAASGSLNRPIDCD